MATPIAAARSRLRCATLSSLETRARAGGASPHELPCHGSWCPYSTGSATVLAALPPVSSLLSWGTAYVIVIWTIRLGSIVFVPLRRSPQAAASWLLLIVFLPIPGLLIYLAIGRPTFPKWRADRFAKLAPFFVDTANRLAEHAPSGDGNAQDIIDLATRLGGLPAVGGIKIEFLDDYDDMIERLLADIDAARQHVRLLVYIFADDCTGRKVVAALARAVARGVACNVLLDPVGSRPWRRQTLAVLRRAGVDARETLPVALWRPRDRDDMRNHRKLFIIDGLIGYAGSQNLIAKDFRPGIINQEMEVRVTGPVVAAMTSIFIADWFMETQVMLEAAVVVPQPDGTTVGQLLPSGETYRLSGFETLLVWQIHSARERVVLTTPYFIPDAALINAMRTAVARGVEVVLIVSAVIDQKLVRLAQCSYYDELMSAGVRIYRFGHYLLHAKNVSIDGRLGIVGSSNVDVRSFKLNEEVSLLLFDTRTVTELEALQSQAEAKSEAIDLKAWRQRPKLHQVGEGLARLVSPLL
jgi:cardiolipin synthase